MPNINPPEYEWDSRWPDVDVAALKLLMEARRDTDVEYDRPDLTKESLDDPFQRLFIDLVLSHVDHILKHLDAPAEVPPLRLLLLGTAGTGKTTAIKTLMQEMEENTAHYKHVY